MKVGTLANANVVTASANETLTVNVFSLNKAASATRVGVLLNVSAVGGTTPSYTVEVQWSADGTNWASAETPDTFTAITANKVVAKAFDVKAQYLRLKYTVTGTTPTATISAQAIAS